MSPVRVPDPLRERLGDAGSEALRDLVESIEHAGREEMLTLATERFGHVVAREVGKVQAEMARLRVEMSEMRGELRAEMGELRAQVSGTRGELRAEMSGMRGELRAEIAASRVDLLRWSFLFWIGQVAAVAGLLSLVVRGLG